MKTPGAPVHVTLAGMLVLVLVQFLLLAMVLEGFLGGRPGWLLSFTLLSAMCFAGALVLTRRLKAPGEADLQGEPGPAPEPPPSPAHPSPRSRSDRARGGTPEFTSGVPSRWPWTTLVASFLHFDMCFMLWVLLGALGVHIAEDLGLDAARKGLLVAIPILSGALLRVPIGLASDRFGGRRVGLAILCFLYLPLTLGWLGGNSFWMLAGVGLMLGTAGASFAVALPLASRWFPAERQGLVVGVAAAGNSGTAVANLTAPILAAHWGWQSVLGWAMLPLTLVLSAFFLMARDKPGQRPPAAARPLRSLVRQQDAWWFSFFYSITFGGYVGLSTFLPLYFRDQYGVSAITAGWLTALAAIVGSAVRPLGGHVADRWGGIRVLSVLLSGLGLLYALAAQRHSLATTAGVIVVTMLFLGMGNGAVFQQVPQRFAGSVGSATGLVGAVGGLGGFCLPVLLGAMKQATGDFGAGFTLLAGAAFLGVALLHYLSTRYPGWCLCWRGSAAAHDHPLPGPAADWSWARWRPAGTRGRSGVA